MKKFIVFFLSLSVLFGYYEKMCEIIPDKIDAFKKEGRCEGMDIKTNEISSSQAVKYFVKDDKNLNIHLLTGTFAMEAGAPVMMNMQMETNDVKIETALFEGYKTMMTYQKQDKSGSFIIVLKPSYVMVVEFENITPEEVKKIIKNYIDLKKIEKEL